MGTLFGVVKMLMLYQHLANRIFRVDKPAIVFHQNGLSLGGIVRFHFVDTVIQFMSVAAQIIQPADFRGPGRNPDHTRAQGMAQAGEDVIVDIMVLRPNQGHRTNFPDQINPLLHCNFTVPLH